MEVVYQSLQSPEQSLALPFDEVHKPVTFKGEPLIKRNINFEKFFLRLDDSDPKDKATIDILEGLRGNAANGGSTFRRVAAELGATIAANEGRTFAAMPDHGIQKIDIENFQYLLKLKANMPPNSRLKAVKLMQEIFERFSISGISKVTSDTKSRVVYSRSIDVLDTLEERGIWKDGNTEGEGHTGQSSAED